MILDAFHWKIWCFTLKNQKILRWFFVVPYSIWQPTKSHLSLCTRCQYGRFGMTPPHHLVILLPSDFANSLLSLVFTFCNSSAIIADAVSRPSGIVPDCLWLMRAALSVTTGDHPQGWFLGGLRGRSPLVKISAHFGGSAPLKLLHCLGFSEFIGLASKVLWSTVRCYMVIEAFLIVDYTISVLN